MNKLLFFAFVVSVLLVSGCGGEGAQSESGKETHPGKINAWTYKVDDLVEEVEDDAGGAEEPVRTVSICYDTDNSINQWKAASVYGFYNNATRFEFNDYCENFNFLYEFYCTNNETPKQEVFRCRNGCVEGHCR